MANLETLEEIQAFMSQSGRNFRQYHLERAASGARLSPEEQAKLALMAGAPIAFVARDISAPRETESKSK